MKAKFLRDARPTEGGDFKANQVVDLSPVSFDRWFRRGAVVECVDDPKQDAAPDAPKPKSYKKRSKTK